MASLVYDNSHFNHTIDKVAKWMATSDSQVCLFADDTSVSILSSVTPSTNTDSEQGRQVLINELKRDAVTRINSLFCSTANQKNNHNKSKKKLTQNQASTLDTDSSGSSYDTSPNRNQNNRHAASESEHRRRSHGDTGHRRRSQPSNSHSTVQRKDSGDGSAGDPKEDKYLERIIERATQEIRSAIYKLRAENKLPEKCHLKMRLSIKPQRSSADNSTPKDSPKEHHRRQRTGGNDDRPRLSITGRHKTSERGGGSGKSGARSDREKRATSMAANRLDHLEQKKDRRKLKS